ncbi:hypothetical protein QOZ80_7AG0557530 [Eleusine coracana subsp. coracana]|nr:hypothetical protein QOZ80_7AG0557530 [Eleusine coracana subsp. coracana]
MLKKKATGGAGAAEPASPSKLARLGNGGSPPSLLLPTRSLPSFFSRDALISPTTTMGEQSKNPPCFGPRNGGVGSQAAGLAAVLVAGEADGGHIKKGRVLLGMRLRVQLPPPPPEKGGSPIEFGVKNRDAQLALLSPVQRSPLSSAARAARRSEEGEELAEDYTCVIARGPNPKMTHIFEDRVVESRAGAGAADGDACCLLRSCCGCEEAAALLLQRGESAISSRQSNDQEALFGKKIRDSTDTSVELKP